MGSRVDFANYGRTVGVDFSVVHEYITLVYTLFNNVIENRQTTKKINPVTGQIWFTYHYGY